MKFSAASLVLFGATLLPAQARRRHASKAPHKTRLLTDVGKEHNDHLDKYAEKCGAGEGSKLEEILSKYGPGGDNDPEELDKKLREQCEKCNQEVANILEEEAKLKEELEEKKAKYCDGGDQEKCDKYMAALDAFKDIEDDINEGLDHKVCAAIEGTGGTEAIELEAAGVSSISTTTATITTTTTTTSTSIVDKEHRDHLDKFAEKCSDGEGSKLNEIMMKYEGEELQKELLDQCEKCNKEVADIVEEEAKLKEELEEKKAKYCGDGDDQEKCNKYTAALGNLMGIIQGTGRIEDLDKKVCDASDAAGITEKIELEAAGVSLTTTITSITTTTATTTSTTSTIDAQKAYDEAKKKLEAAKKEATEVKDEVGKIQKKIDDLNLDDWLATLNMKQGECVTASKALTEYVKSGNLYDPDSDNYNDLMDEQKEKCDSALQVEKEIYDLKPKVEKLKEDLVKKTAEQEEADQNVSEAQDDVNAKQVDLENVNAGVRRRARATKKNLRSAYM